MLFQYASCTEYGKLDWVQAVSAVQTFNGTELAGRKILVREDREDRDVKQYNKDNGIETPEREFRPPRRERRPRENRPPREDGAPRHERRTQESASSGLQVRLLAQSLQDFEKDAEEKALRGACLPSPLYICITRALQSFATEALHTALQCRKVKNVIRNLQASTR